MEDFLGGMAGQCYFEEMHGNQFFRVAAAWAFCGFSGTIFASDGVTISGLTDRDVEIGRWEALYVDGVATTTGLVQTRTGSTIRSADNERATWRIEGEAILEADTWWQDSVDLEVAHGGLLHATREGPFMPGPLSPLVGRNSSIHNAGRLHLSKYQRGPADVEASGFQQTSHGVLRLEYAEALNDSSPFKRPSLAWMNVYGSASLAGGFQITTPDLTWGQLPESLSSNLGQRVLYADEIVGAFEWVEVVDANWLSASLESSGSSRLFVNFSRVYLPGDLNDNGRVDQSDLNLVLSNWGQLDRPAEMLNTEGLATPEIDQEELNAVLSNWGSSSAPSFASNPRVVPEPGLAALALVGLGRRVRSRRA